MTAALDDSIRAVRDELAALATDFDAGFAELRIALDALDAAIKRLGETLPGHADQMDERATVLGIKPGIVSEQ